MPGQWLVLLVLLLPQWLASPLTAPAIRSFSWLHETRWGAGICCRLAAPLWLALLSALQFVSVQVPRAVVGATIAGIAAVCLVIPTDAYAVAPNQTPVLVLQLLLNILIVASRGCMRPASPEGQRALPPACVSAAERGGQCSISRCCLSAASWQPVDWRELAIPLLIQAAVIACLWTLWFWLLERMTLAAFGMRALAMWTASIIPGFVLAGFLNWRIDLALAIAVGAVVIALRARVVDEQPTALGLGGA